MFPSSLDTYREANLASNFECLRSCDGLSINIYKAF